MPSAPVVLRMKSSVGKVQSTVCIVIQRKVWWMIANALLTQRFWVQGIYKLLDASSVRNGHLLCLNLSCLEVAHIFGPDGMEGGRDEMRGFGMR